MVISRDEQNMQPFYKCQCKGIRKGNALFHCSDSDPLHELISGVPSRYGYVAARGPTLARRFPVYQIGINSLQLTMPTASLTAGRYCTPPVPLRALSHRTSPVPTGQSCW